LALVPLGYADGVDRDASNRATVYLAGASRQIVGRVAMDVLSLDVGMDDVRVGDEAVLFGDPRDGEPSLDEWATVLGTNQLAVTCGIGARVARVWE
jgi:alanine racemase